MKNNYAYIRQTLSRALSILFLFAALFSSGKLSAQLTGTVTVPSANYPDLKVAIDSLNLYGVGLNGLTINLLAANPQTAPAGGYSITASGTATNTVVIMGNGNIITAPTPQAAGSLTDAIFKLVGADYITITGFDMRENAANTTTASATNNMTEWGVALLYGSLTDGAQNNTIISNTITLSRTYSNSFGIYSNTRHAATSVTLADITAATGANNNNKVYGNTISNVNMGVSFIGSGTAAYQDMGNDIGGASASTGNVITNWGGAAATGTYPSNSGTSYCILMNHQVADNISYNTITSATVTGTSVSFRGILKDYTGTAPTGTFVSTVTNNTVTLKSGFTSGTFEAIRSQGMTSLSTATITISDNLILNCAISGAGSSSALLCIGNSSVPGTLNIANNIIRGNTSTATTGGFTGITNTGAVTGSVNISNNQVGNASGNAFTFSAVTSGSITGITNSGSVATGMVTISNNNFQGFVQSVTSTSTYSVISNTAANGTVTISGNTFTNLNANTSGSFVLIGHGYTVPANGVQTISNNSIVTGFTKAAGSTVYFMRSASSSVLSTASITHANNNFSNVTVTGATTVTGIFNTDGLSTTQVPKTVTGNVMNNWSGGTGALTGIVYSYFGGSSLVSNNSVTNLTGQGAVTGYSLTASGNNASPLTISSNTVTGLSSTGTGGTVTGILCSNSSPTVTISGNIVASLSSTGASSAVSGISITGGSTTTISGNSVTGLSSTGSTSPVVTGILLTAGTTMTISGNTIGTLSNAGTSLPEANGITVSGGSTINIIGNKVYDISQSGALNGATVGVNGILLSGGATVTAYNNIVGDLRAPASMQAEAIRGISITSVAVSFYNVYYNTVYLAATSSATDFGTSALFHADNATSNVAALELRNNILINKSTANGTGLTVAYRTSGTTLANYGSTSNNNLFYAGTPSATNLIFYDGTNSAQTLAAYQTLVGPTRDALSVTENTAFLNTATGSAANFLHVDGSVPSLAESGAVNISGITDDYDANIRAGNGGYAGTGTAPDIGADEFAGTNPASCSGTPTAGSITGANGLCAGMNTTLSLSGASAGAGYTYAWGSSATPGGPYTPMGTAQTQPTGTLSATTYYTATVTCTGSGLSATTAEFTLTVNPLPTLTVTPAAATICLPSSPSATLTVSGASTYNWSPATSLNVSTGTTVIASPTATTVYTVTGTDANNCFNSTTATVTVSSALSVSVTSTPASLCAGGTATLTASAQTSAAYCASTHSSANCNNGAEAIMQVVLNTLNNASACAPSANYEYFTGGGTQTTALTAGNTYTLSVTFGSDATQYFGAWIDYDQDGILASGEFLGASANAGSNGTTSIVFTVPAGAYNGITRLRIVGGNDSPVTAAQACGASSSIYGETEDYDVTIGSGITNISYSWSPGTFLNSTTGDIVTASSVTATTTYSATATSAAGCAATGTFTLSVDPLSGVGLTVTPSATVCAGTSVTISSTLSGGGAPFTYSWSPGGQTTANVTVTPSVTTSYTVSVNDNCGGSVSNTVTVVVNALPPVAVTPTSTLYCIPGTAPVLNASGATTYTWSPASGLSGSTGATVVASPTVTTTYTVTGSDGTCSNTASVTITAAPALSGYAALATPTVVCSGDPVGLNASASTYSVGLLSENFNSGAPSWTRVNNSTGGTPADADWKDRPNGYVYSTTTFMSNDNTQFVLSNSDDQGSGGTTNTILQSPAFSTTGLSGVSLKFYHYYRHISGDSAIIEASTNGTSWTQVANYQATTGAASAFVQGNVTLPAAFDNQATVYVRFRYYATYGWYWALDNVSVSGSSSTYTYSWTSAPAGFTSSVQSPTVNPTVSTTYSVDIANIYGCAATASVAVTVNPLPVVNLGNDTNFCGTNLLLDAGNPGASYLWSDASTNQTLNVTSSGIYNVTVTTPQNCVDKDTIFVVIRSNPVVNLGGDTVRCGGTVLLDAGNPGASYAWSDLSTNQTLNVSSSGTYYVAVTNSVACTASDTVNVTINPVPVIALGNDTMLCGGTLVLDAGNPGSVYLWNNATSAQTLTVTGTGLYFVDVTTPQNCTNRDSINVTVNPAVAVNLGNDTAICSGANLTLDAQNAGASYLWSDNSTGPTLVVNTPGTYYVSVSYTTGCSASDTIAVSNGTPVVTLALMPGDSVCANAAPVTLGGGTPAGGTFSGTGVTAGMFNPSVAGTGTTTITYSYTDPNSGCPNSATDVMTVLTAPNVTLTLPIDSVCVNAAPVSLTGESPAGGAFSGTAVSGNTFDPATAGVGTFVITYAYTDGTTGCSGNATDNIVVKSCIRVEQYNIGLVKVFPNPTSGSFAIEIPDAAQTVKATLHSVEGKLIFTSELSGKTLFSFDISKLQDGVYYLELRSAEGSKVIKLVKQY
jgi:hypothetical protein